MPGAYTIDVGRRVVLTRVWGTVGQEEFLVHARALVNDPRFVTSFRQLADFREVTDLRIHSAFLHEFARISPFGPGARRAMVVSSEVAYGLGRMFQILREDYQDGFAVFHDLDAALDWIGLTDHKPAVLSGLADAPALRLR